MMNLNAINMEKLKEDIAKFNKDYLIGKPYQESIYVKKEMNNFILKKVV